MGQCPPEETIAVILSRRYEYLVREVVLDKERIHPSCVLEIGHAELTDGLEVAVRERWIPSIIIF